MQGGVCYNRAVPYAMANLINKEIIVPPEPGLMGAFGVALEIKNRIDNGQIEPKEFNLDDLINREFSYGHEFICAGGKEKCDRGCSIALIEIEGKKYPFGGACNKYYNLRQNIKVEPAKNDYVRIRQGLIDGNYSDEKKSDKKSIGISRSFQTNSLFPLFYNFFNELGLNVVLSDKVEREGIEKMRSAFCYPVEISHGLFQNLLNKNLDYIFLPHITQMFNLNGEYNKLCVFVQGESYYLRSTFRDEKLPQLITPIIDFSKSQKEIEKVFISIGKQINKSSSESKSAFEYAFEIQNQVKRRFKEIGDEVLAQLEEDKSRFALVLFGRSYSAFADEANLNIPHKVASKGITIIPYDFLRYDNYDSFENMYWHTGNQ
ncbi:MAG: acyl-CoA dehydratase activase-related protein, partial [Ignavibacteria bacterium]|nr:acyl-CoA dehydratase activase-related protein [Ignavibacteria bacterium]